MGGEYARFDALGLATLIASGEGPPDEIMMAARSRIAECNPLLNAIIDSMTLQSVSRTHGSLCRRAVSAQGYWGGIKVPIASWQLSRCASGSMMMS